MAGTITVDTVSNGAGTKTISASNLVDGSAKAWVNFNGTGTVAIRASFNVLSITDNGVGDYTVNFINAMPDANYAVSAITGNATNSILVRVPDTPLRTTTAFKVHVIASTFANIDAGDVHVSFFR